MTGPSKVVYLADRTNDNKAITVDQALEQALAERKDTTGRMGGDSMLLVMIDTNEDGTWSFDWRLVNMELSRAMCVLRLVEKDFVDLLLGTTSE